MFFQTGKASIWSTVGFHTLSTVVTEDQGLFLPYEVLVQEHSGPVFPTALRHSSPQAS